MNINEVITSRNNPTVKWAASLADKKGRGAARSFIAEGVKLTCEAITAGLPVTHIFIAEGKRNAVEGAIEEALSDSSVAGVKIYLLSDEAFAKISTEKSPQGVISVIKYLDFFYNIDIIYKEDFFLAQTERAIALCSVRDPSNLGSVIRSSVAFGVDHIILSEDCADPYNPKTVRSAMGSLFRVKITRVRSIADFVSAAEACGRRTLAAELTEGAKSLSDIGIRSTDIVMIGNEGHGIPEEISAMTSSSVYIPISKKTESLNAAVAAAIFMWEQSKN